MKLAEGKFGKLNILFNNAGIMHSNDDNAVTTTEEIWDLTMNVNVKVICYDIIIDLPKNLFVFLFFSLILFICCLLWVLFFK